jgi:hypothetical protein
MSFITVEEQPAGEIRHGRHCQGGKPGWKACQRCAAKEAAACVAFWETMGGVPEIVRMHVTERMTGYTRKPVTVSPIALIDWA